MSTPRTRRAPPGAFALGVLAVALLALFLWPYVQEGFRFPLGADAPVYLWWARLAGHDGLSAVGERPGVPALLLVLSGTLRLPLVAVTAGVSAALGVAVGLGAAALVRSRHGVEERTAWVLAKQDPERDRPEWLLAGLLAGVFAVHLVAGYAANLAFAVGFLAAGAALAAGTRRAAIGAAFALGGAGLMHPLFFLLGLAILVGAAVPSLVRELGSRPRSGTEWGRIAIGAGGACAIVGAGLLALLAGPPPPDFETSKDGLLRRFGLTGELREAFVDRFVHRWARYVQWASVPLAILGLSQARGFVGRLLRSWGAATMIGVVVGLATAWFPPDRFVTFGYVIPILAALGVVRLARALAHRRWVAAVAVVGVCAAMIAGASIAWSREEPFMSAEEVSQVSTVARLISSTPVDTEVVFEVDSGKLDGLFLSARASNVIRAAMPPERIRHAHVLYAPVGRPVPGSVAAIFLAAYESELDRLVDDPARRLSVVAGAFSVAGARAAAEDSAATEVAPGVWVKAPRGLDLPTIPAGAAQPDAAGADELEPTSPGEIVLAGVAILLLLWAAGYGWARAALGAGLPPMALAPAFGMSAITVFAVALERVGVPLTGAMGPTAVTVLAGGGGYLVAVALGRRSTGSSP